MMSIRNIKMNTQITGSSVKAVRHTTIMETIMTSTYYQMVRLAASISVLINKNSAVGMYVPRLS